VTVPAQVPGSARHAARRLLAAPAGPSWPAGPGGDQPDLRAAWEGHSIVQRQAVTAAIEKLVINPIVRRGPIFGPNPGKTSHGHLIGSDSVCAVAASDWLTRATPDVYLSLAERRPHVFR
jgi:hypothetical protein